MIRTHRRFTAHFQEHSRDLIAAEPGWFTRHGTALITLVLLLLFCCAGFVQLPETIVGEMQLTTDPMPVELKAGNAGHIRQLLAVDGSRLKKGAPAAELENNCGLDQILLLEEFAGEAGAALRERDPTAMGQLAHTDRAGLGDGQQPYNALCDALENYRLLLTQAGWSSRSAMLQTEAGGYRQLADLGTEEKRNIAEGLADADERFRANEQLYSEKIISRQEYLEEAERLRKGKAALQLQQRSGIQNSIAAAHTRKEQQDYEIERGSQESVRAMAVREAIRNLQNFTREWRARFLLLMPYDGQLHFLRPLQRNEPVVAGESLFAVVPDVYRYTARLTVPASGSGKIRKGQPVTLLPDEFPAAEYGVLHGTVASSTALPRRSPGGMLYSVTVVLPDSLRTSYGRLLPFHGAMGGKGRIILQERSLLRRLFAVVAGLKQ